MEIWADVIGYENEYQVSSLGRVRSKERVVFRKDNKVVKFKECILKPSNQGTGYLKVCLSKKSNLKQFTIHRLMGYAFLSLSDDMCIDHINGKRDDNRLENLRVCTKRQNSSYSNRVISKTSKYVGVHYAKIAKKWIAAIKINGVKKHLGLFINEDEAKKAYDDKLEELNRLF